MINSSMQNLTLAASFPMLQGGRVLAEGGMSLPEVKTEGAVSAAKNVVAVDAEKPAQDEQRDVAAAVAMPAESMEVMARKMNEMLQNMQRDLEFQVDTESGKTVFRVVHGSTGEVIRQVPSEEALALAEALADGRATLIRDQA